MFNIFEQNESNVRSYCRNFPAKFNLAKNAELFTEDNERYIDFFAGAGAMNYGHNNSYIKNAILEYLSEDTIIHALDMYTVAKEKFIKTFKEKILEPRNLNYKTMFCGATGTNAVEAALKLSRKNKHRSNIIAFAGAFHGMSLGSLALTTDRHSRAGAGVSLPDVSFVPFDNHMSIDYLHWALEDDHSGIDKPAAIFLETLQAEGGINVASVAWLKDLKSLCEEHDILLVVDDIQVGNWRTGTFFSFERAGIEPDMVILSKSISGFGLPMSILLMKPELDIFSPAEHNGTFRGHQLAFVGATAAIEYSEKFNLQEQVVAKETIVKEFLEKEILPLNNKLSVRGKGLIWGIDFHKINMEISKEVMKACFNDHMIIERAGRGDSVLKIMPPLTIEETVLTEGLEIIKNNITKIL